MAVIARVMGSLEVAPSCGRWCRKQATDVFISWSQHADEEGRVHKTEDEWTAMVWTSSTHMRVLAVMGIIFSLQFRSMLVALNFSMNNVARRRHVTPELKTTHAHEHVCGLRSRQIILIVIFSVPPTICSEQCLVAAQLQ